MDRFIAPSAFSDSKITIFLKSNMDRFIGVKIEICNAYFSLLKSNMDRFIESSWTIRILKILF